eukprot:1700967-Pyramimonas_sp.AAC.1
MNFGEQRLLWSALGLLGDLEGQPGDVFSDGRVCLCAAIERGNDATKQLEHRSAAKRQSGHGNAATSKHDTSSRM